MWKRCFPVIFLVFASSAVNALPGYLFTIPRFLWKGTNEQYCISYHGDSIVTFNVSLRHLVTNEQYWFDEQTFDGESSRCIDFEVPDSKGKVNVSLVGRNLSGEILYSEMGSSEIFDTNLLTLIQTDKPLYKPGQLVKFRILTFKQNLKPRTGIISLVSILNPSGVRVMQWKDVDASQGLVSFEFQLSKEPQLNTWKIEAQVDGEVTRQNFKVEEYVLPKYEVTITPPKYLLPTSETIDGTVCAKYTYGKAVRGLLALKLCFGSLYHYSWRYRAHEESSRRPCAVHLADIDGCYSFSINSTELGLRSSRYGRWGQLIINATVEEQATGVVLEKQSHGPGMTFDPIRIIMKDDDSSYFKPGIPYVGRVIATKPDGTPAAGELIEVTGQNWKYDYHVQKNLTTDENGIARFYVTDIPTNVTSINFNAKAVMYGSRQSYFPYYHDYGGRHYYGDSYLQVYTPTTYHNIKKWYSPSNSYIQIEPVEEPVRCGTNLSLIIHYTTPPNTNYKFHYIVMSNNRIIHSGHKHHQFEIQNTIDINIDTDSVLKEFVPEPIEMPWWRRPDPPIVEPPMPPTPNTSVSINSTSTTDSPVRDPVPDPIPVNEEIIVPEIVNPLGDEETESQKEEEGEKRVPVVEDEIIPEMASILGRERRAAEDDDTADVVLSDHSSRLSITIPVSAMMSPSAQVMIYYVREDGETVSSSREFSVEKCFNNNVTMDFVEKTVHPGNEVEIRLKADPGSLCSVGVVDKSINLLGGDHQITPEKIFNMFNRFSYLYRYSYWREDREYCRQKLNRTDGYSLNFQDVDAMQAFRDMNLLVLSDLKIMTRPCQVFTMEPRMYHSMPDMQETPMQLGESGTDPRARQQPIANRGGSAQRKQETRSFFPETWLWDLELIGETGELTKRAEIPHTITKWVGNSICTNLETGMGVSSMTGITAFQPFFLSFTLPYSAIRGEEIPVLVTIFNYMSDSLVMSVSLIPSSGYMLRNDEERSRIECVHGGESSTIKYYITPVELGKIQLTASAESIFDNGTCNNKAVSLDGANAYDTVRREILIEPEGVEQEYTLTSYVCALGEEEETQMNLVLSKDLVLDSERAYINVIGDIMGPALSNLKDLLRMPYGCGEQNMASMSPNIFVLQYLTNTNQLTDKTERQAKEYMRIGYQRQLNYRHADGSYSAFGGSGSGSMWLTAFVVKCLGQSSPYIDIDVDDLDKSTTWFRRKQLENGCFPNVGYTHSIYLKGGINSSNDLSMTAFVLISMLESGVNKSDSAVLNALRCLDIHNATDTYTLSLVAYAYTLFDINYPRRSEVMSQLLSRAKRPTGDMMYWSRNTEVTDEIPYSYYRRASSAEVEITSYALLAFISGAQVDAVSNARPIVLWLSKQRNGYGGFSSTQDTVIGLQALSRYATLVYSSDELDVTVQISGEQFYQNYSITHDNSLVLQSTPLDTLPNQLTATVSGIGCALIQANVRYNIDKVPKGPAFDLKVGVHRSKTDRNNCAKRTMQICTSYQGPGDHSHMAIVEVKMVTGWIPVKDTVRKLVKKNISRQSMEYLGIEKVEIDQNYVNFYFNELDAGRRCFYFDVEQIIEVSQPKPAFIKVYDYYETELNLLREYSIKTLCGTKEELPFLTPDEYLMGLQDEGPIMQVRERVPVPNPNNEGGIDSNAFLQTCPICSGSDDFDSESKLYKKLVCDSPKIYKALSGRSGMYKMKIYADIRTKPKITVDSFSNYNMADGCPCEILKQKEQKLLIFTTENTFVKENKIIALDERSTVVAWNKILEKKINKLVRRRRGGCS